MKADWLAKHADTVVVIAALFAGLLWINTKFNSIETRLTRIETVLILKNIMPNELCVNNDNEI